METQIYAFEDEMQKNIEPFFDVAFGAANKKFAPEDRHSELRKIKETYFDGGGGFWVLLFDNKIIGTVALKVLNPEEQIGEVKCMYVLSQMQGRGFGERLLLHVFEEAKNRKLKILRLDAMRNAQKALNLYRKHGFSEIERYNQNFVAEIFMEKIM